MMRRILWLLITALVGLSLLYISRFWLFDLWARDGLFGIKALRPQGGLLALWLRETPFAPFELLIWISGTFMSLTWLENLYHRLMHGGK